MTTSESLVCCVPFFLFFIFIFFIFFFFCMCNNQCFRTVDSSGPNLPYHKIFFPKQKFQVRETRVPSRLPWPRDTSVVSSDRGTLVPMNGSIGWDPGQKLQSVFYIKRSCKSEVFGYFGMAKRILRIVPVRPGLRDVFRPSPS